MKPRREDMKIALFYYTQSGQALDIARSISRPLEAGGCRVVYHAIVPEREFPFPWDSASFFDIFPETRLGQPPVGIQPIDCSDVADAELCIVVGQSWFLSPSVPIQSFFTDPSVRDYLRGRRVVFVNGSRNMWLMTARRIREYVREAGARLVGHIVLQDDQPNLVSVATIIRWLIYGRKEATRLLPRAGVPERDIESASRFGDIILSSLSDGNTDDMQTRLMEAGAIDYRPGVLFLERNGHRIFGFWARFIRACGPWGDPSRRWRRRMFATYLMFVLYVVSPFGSLFFWLTRPMRDIAGQRREDCYNLS